MRLLKKILIPLYLIIIVGLFFYSYTQVDLSLTLSRTSIFQIIEKSFQYIGYFQRPLSTYFYSTILVLLFATYIGFLILTAKNTLSRKTLWTLIIFTACLLTFSYNAFSYDIFNYIFYGKTVTHYFQNPYTTSPLNFPHEPMLSFMHWTQSTYPYGPIYLLIDIPLSFIGLQIFLPTFFLFKMSASLSYVGIAWAIEKISEKTDGQSLLPLVFFAFSPLVIIESLVSSHNDIVMILFSSLALLTFVNKKSVWSFLLLFLSIGIKFATAVLLPLWIIRFFIKKKGNFLQLCLMSTMLLIIPIIVASFRTNFQSWYLLFLFPFVAFLSKRMEMLVGFSVLSFFVLLTYIPFLYTGNWNPPIPTLLHVFLWTGIGLGFASSLLLFFAKRLVAK